MEASHQGLNHSEYGVPIAKARVETLAVRSATARDTRSGGSPLGPKNVVARSAPTMQTPRFWGLGSPGLGNREIRGWRRHWFVCLRSR